MNRRDFLRSTGALSVGFTRLRADDGWRTFEVKTRAEILIAVTEMDLAKKRTSGDPPLQ